METWLEKSCVCASDSVIADKVCKVNADMERSNREATVASLARMDLQEVGRGGGQPLHATSCRQAVRESTLRRIVPNGFLLRPAPFHLRQPDRVWTREGLHTVAPDVRERDQARLALTPA
jgi:hypothetical protein